MLTYIFIFLIAVIMLISKDALLRNLFLILMIFVSGFRDMIGGFDIYIYSEIYEVLKGKALFLYEPFEKGFIVFYFLLQKINESREFMIFFTSFAFIGFYFFVLKHISINKNLTLFIFFGKFFLFTFTYIRQNMANMFILLAVFLMFKYYEKVKINIIILILLAFTFHKSAILFMLFPLVVNYKLQKTHLFFIPLIIIVLNFSGLSNLFVEEIATQIEDSKLNTYSQLSNTFNIFYLLEGLVLVFLTLKFYDKITTKRDFMIVNGLLIYIIIILASLFNATFVRFSWYFFIFVILFIDKISQEEDVKKLINPVLILYFGFIYFRYLTIYGEGEFYPYKSIFEDFERNGVWEWMEYR